MRQKQMYQNLSKRRHCEFPALLALLMTTAFLFWHLNPGLATESVPGGKGPELLFIGNPGPDAIGLKVWTNQPKDRPFKPGERVIIYFTTTQKAYLTVLSVSVEGDAIVLFPNKQVQDSLILPEKEYTLFGDEWPTRLVLGEKPPKSQIVFYISSEKFDLSPLKMSQEQFCVRVSKDSKTEMGTLTAKLGAMAQNKGFNRIVLGLKTGADREVEIKLMGVGGKPKADRVPSDAESRKPEPVVGVQGEKDTGDMPDKAP